MGRDECADQYRYELSEYNYFQGMTISTNYWIFLVTFDKLILKCAYYLQADTLPPITNQECVICYITQCCFIELFPPPPSLCERKRLHIPAWRYDLKLAQRVVAVATVLPK